jgi:peptide/nickel transport system substrate-binding protein
MRKPVGLGGVLLGVLLGLAAQPAAAQKAADQLRVVTGNAVTNVDPYYNSQRTGLVIHQQAWDGLVYRDPDTFLIKPLLASEWKVVGDTMIEFRLRPGVKFHDGSMLSADDVVYTVNLISDPDSKVATPSNYNWIDRAEKVDDLVVRVHLKRPTPAALDYFALVVPIYPKGYREKVGADGYAKAPIGSGPYRITKVEAGALVELERFEDYWSGSPKGRPAIKKLSMRFVPEPATELTELLAGRADWIWNMSADQFDNVNRMPNLLAVRQESMRIGYLSIDAAGRSAANNPLTNLKVRQAIFHALDRKTMADKLITGGSRVPQAPCYPRQFGCDEGAAVSYNYDPERASKLLAEAGFPNGFETELVSYNPPQWTAAVQNYLQAVGIKSKVSQLQVAAAIQRAWKGETPLYFGSWGSYSINDVSANMPNFFTFGNDDYARDAELKHLLEEGGSSNEPGKRKAAYSAAIRIVTEKAYWVPMFTFVTIYAHSKQLSFTPYADELPRYYLASWK